MWLIKILVINWSLSGHLGCPSLVGPTNLRIPTITFPSLLNSSALLSHTNWRTSSCGICKICYLWSTKGKTQKYFCLLLLIYRKTFHFPPLSETLKVNFACPSLLSAVTYYHAPFSLCAQLTVYVKMASPPSLPENTSPLESHSWKKGKLTLG